MTTPTPTYQPKSILDFLRDYTNAHTNLCNHLNIPDNMRDLAIKDETGLCWKLTDDECILLGDEPDDLDSEAVTFEIHDFVRRPFFTLVVIAPDTQFELYVLSNDKEVK